MAKHEGRTTGLPSLSGALLFSEAAVWAENMEFVRKALDIPCVEVVDVTANPAAAAVDPTGRAKDVVPGEPAVHAGTGPSTALPS